MKYRTLVAVYSALLMLSRRKLPSIKNDLKIAKMAKKLRPAYEIYEELRKKIVENLDQTNVKQVAEVERQIADLLNQDAEIPEMTLKVKREDLPLEVKSDGGEMNTAGIAAIIIDLGEYFEDADTE